MAIIQQYTKEVIDSKLINEFNAGCNVLKNKLLYNNEAPRDLLSLCDKEYREQMEAGNLPAKGFAMFLNGNVVCRHGIEKKVECPYQDNERDQSGIFQCSQPSIVNEYENFLKLTNTEYNKMH